MTLMAHCDTKKVDESTVFSVPEVEGTDTWMPVHHGNLITTMEDVIYDQGHQVIKRSYSLSGDGKKMFGCWELQPFDGTMAYTLGFRNSMDKSMALGLVGGTKVFVCDNLSFSGDFIAFRRHTANILHDLPKLVFDAITELNYSLKAFAAWHKKLSTYILRRVRAQILTVKAMDMGVITPSDYRKLYGAYFDHGAEYGEPNLYAFHGAITSILRDKNLFANHQRNTKLNKLCNEYIHDYPRLSSDGI